LGFRLNHTLACIPKSERRKASTAGWTEDARNCLLGNSFSCYSVALVLGNLLWQVGLLPSSPPLKVIYGQLWDDEEDNVRANNKYHQVQNICSATRGRQGSSPDGHLQGHRH
jgi:hypothetical protein